MSNPFMQRRQSLDPTDIRNALSDIKSDIEQAFHLLETHERKATTDSEIQMVLHLSGLEIKMTNFAAMMRKKFAS